MKPTAAAPAAFCAAATTAVLLGIGSVVVMTHSEWIAPKPWRDAILPRVPLFSFQLSLMVLAGWGFGGYIGGRYIRIPWHQACLASAAFATITAGAAWVIVTSLFPLRPDAAFLTLPLALTAWVFIGSLGVSFAFTRRAGRLHRLAA